LLLFVDQDSGEPKGNVAEYKNHILLNKVVSDWQCKLWWPHSEALYTSMLAYNITNDNFFSNMYNKVHEYTFSTFPNKNKDIGEWIQIRDRKGNSINKTVALPVKDPFHVMRNVILIIELLSKCKK
jgi:N-acylglucosamine 2-epimerase